MSAGGRRRLLSFCLKKTNVFMLDIENLCIHFFFSGTHQNIPANQRPWSAFTVAIAAGIDGHFTYTFPCNDKNELGFYFRVDSHPSKSSGSSGISSRCE